MPVNTYKFNTCQYWCVEVIKHMPETITIKRNSVDSELKKKGKFYNRNTIGNALNKMVIDGHLVRESVNFDGEVLYNRKEVICQTGKKTFL